MIEEWTEEVKVAIKKPTPVAPPKEEAKTDAPKAEGEQKETPAPAQPVPTEQDYETR